LEKVPFILKEEILSQQQTKEKVLLILKKEILSQQQSKEKKGECSPYPTFVVERISSCRIRRTFSLLLLALLLREDFFL
jgi:hypothetical protein